MQRFRKEIAQILRKEIGGKAGLSSKRIQALLELPADSSHGDFAFPCFVLAKHLKKAPKAIATELADKLKLTESIERVDIVAGYINFFIKPGKLAEAVLGSIFTDKDAYGASDQGKGKKIVIEYSSPNIAKPFGIGHLRSTIIGNSLKRVAQFLNYETVAINHLGDWGTQFGKIISAYKKWGNADFLKGNPIMNLYALYVKFHDEEKKDPSLSDEARGWFAKLESGDQEARELWEWFRDLSMEELRGIYSTFDIDFDYQLGESFYIDKLPKVIEELEERKLLEESEGAQIVRLEKEELPPALIKKKDQSTLYLARDLAAAIYRHDTYEFDEMLYVVGMPQQMHFQQLFCLLKQMDRDWSDTCEHIGFGHLSLRDSNEKMSTRSGNIIFLKDVLNKAIEMAGDIIKEKSPELEDRERTATQVGIAALIYADFSAKRRKDVKFSWDEILSFEGETGPYLQYTSVRLRSLLEKFSGTLTNKIDFDKLSMPEERDLIKHLGLFGSTLKHTLRDREPFVLAAYSMQTAKLFNKFYNKCRILDQDGEISLARVLLTHCTSITLDSSLKLLGMPIPEKM